MEESPRMIQYRAAFTKSIDSSFKAVGSLKPENVDTVLDQFFGKVREELGPVVDEAINTMFSRIKVDLLNKFEEYCSKNKINEQFLDLDAASVPDPLSSILDESHRIKVHDLENRNRKVCNTLITKKCRL